MSAALLVLAALALRLVVPAGFMPVASPAGPMLALCSGNGPMQMPMPGMASGMAMPAPMSSFAMPGMAHHGDPAPAASQGCAFADLALSLLGTADVLQPTPPAAFAIAATSAIPAPFRLAAPAHLRPPLRGPPLLV